MINKLKSFIQDEDGIATVWAMGWLVLCLALSGLAIDTTNAFRIRQMLQDTADIAAHAGVLELATAGNADIEARVEAAANQFADLNMGNKRFGDVLINSDILVGKWDPLAKTFVEMPVGSVVSPNAVKVVTRQSGGASSVVGTFFLRFVGFNFFTLDASAVAMQFVSKCDRDGIIAGGIVKLSTQQQFLDGFCIHGQQGIDMSVANYFELGTIASMPDLALCGPSSGHCLNDKNAGVEEALRQYTMVPDKVAKIDTYITELQNPLSALQPNFIKDATLPRNYLLSTLNSLYRVTSILLQKRTKTASIAAPAFSRVGKSKSQRSMYSRVAPVLRSPLSTENSPTDWYSKCFSAWYIDGLSVIDPNACCQKVLKFELRRKALHIRSLNTKNHNV